MLENIVKGFDIWTDAQGMKSKGRSKSIDNTSFEGIASLRKLILQLAMRGKLVPQNPSDEPACELLKKVSKEKERLEKQKVIGKQDKLPEVSDKDKEFDIPPSWEWTRLGNISFQITDGAHHTPVYTSKGVPFLSVKDLSSRFIDFSQSKYISQKQHEDLIKRCNPQRGDLLLTKVGTTGIPVLVDTDRPFSLFVSVALIKFAKEHILGKFLSLLIESPLLKKQSEEGTEGIGNKNLVLRKIVSFKIVIPPFEEQKRIVAKVGELMALCDKLEQEKTASLKTHQTLVAALLQTLTAAKDASELDAAWNRLAPHFDTLFCTEDSINQLKQTILQLAVMGRLVKQDPADEPASELLEKIEKEKEKLVKEGKIKREKPLPEIKDDEKPFELPSGWEWVRIGSVAEIKGGKRLPAGHSFAPHQTPHIYIQVTNMKKGTILHEDLKYISDKTHAAISKYTISKEDLYITIAGTIGDVGIVPDFFDGMNLTENAAKIQFTFLNKYWLQKALTSSTMQVQFVEKTKQLAQPKLALHRVESSFLPLPPLAEQHRINEKIENLMVLCDNLKKGFLKSQEIQNTLSQTIVEKAVA